MIFLNENESIEYKLPDIIVQDISEISIDERETISEIIKSEYIGPVIVLETISSKEIMSGHKFNTRNIMIGNDDDAPHNAVRFKVYNPKNPKVAISIILDLNKKTKEIYARYKGDLSDLNMRVKELHAYYDFGIRNYALLKYCTKRKGNVKYAENEIIYDENLRINEFIVYRNIDDPFTCYRTNPHTGDTIAILRR